MDEFTKGYIVGLMVIQAYFVIDSQQPYIGMKLSVDDPNPLFLLQDELGGKVYGPYNHNERRYWLWRLYSKDDIPEAIVFLDRYLPRGQKRNKYVEWKKSLPT